MAESFWFSGMDITDFVQRFLYDLTDSFSSGEIASRILGFMGAGLAFLAVFSIVGLFFAVIAYIFAGFTRMLAGRKAGYHSDWMAFVPFVWDVYKLKFTSSPLGDLFFFGSTGIAFIVVINVLLAALAVAISPVFTVIAVLVTLVFIVMRYIVTYKFNVRYYGGFGFDTKLALLTFIPGEIFVSYIIDIIIAFKKDIKWTGEPATSAPAAPPPSYQSEGAYRPVPPTAPTSPAEPPVIAAPVVVSQAPAAGIIRAISGEYEGSEFPIKVGDEIIMGSDATCCSIVLSGGGKIGLRHCAVCFNAADNKYVVTDYSSSGTFTGDERRLQPNTPTLLFPGTVIYLGDKTCSFRLG